MMVYYKEFLPQDFGRVLELDHFSFSNEIAYSESQLRELFADPEILCYTVKDDTNFIIGCCIIKLKKFSNALRVISITIDPQFRKKGIGSLILENIIKAGEFLNVEKIAVQIESANDAGVALFNKFKFKNTKNLEDFLTSGNKGQEMELVLIKSTNKIKVHSAFKSRENSLTPTKEGTLFPKN